MGFECQVLLDNPTRTYVSGETITGTVVVVSDSEKDVKGLAIKIIGKANIRFQEKETRVVPNHMHHNQNNSGIVGTGTSTAGTSFPATTTTQIAVKYEAEEDYLSATLNIFGNVGTPVAIPRGRHSYPFGFKLPGGLPSSLKGRHGSVVYYVEAILGRSWAFDCKTKVGFNIYGLVDLNKEPMAQQPVEKRKSKTFGFCCCESGPLSILLRLSKAGFVPGEFVPFLLEINNNSDKNIKGKLYLIQTITYHAKGRSKIEREIVATAEGQMVLPGDSDIWQGNILQVPQVPPTNLGGCRLINVTYEFQVEMKCSGLSSNLKASVPVVIGTIPIAVNQGVNQPLHLSVYQTVPQAYHQFPSAPHYGFEAVGQEGPQNIAYLPPPPFNPTM